MQLSTAAAKLLIYQAFIEEETGFPKGHRFRGCHHRSCGQRFVTPMRPSACFARRSAIDRIDAGHFPTAAALKRFEPIRRFSLKRK
jgi:hypothetical protein